MGKWLLALNVGSSSVKFAAYPAAGGGETLRGAVTGVDGAPRLGLRHGVGAFTDTSCAGAVTDLSSAISYAIEVVFDRLSRSELVGVGHRIVHGGAEFTKPVRLTPAIVERLRGFAPLAPLHQLFSLAAIDLVSSQAPGVAQIGCFDTGFHAAQPRTSRLLAIPRELEQRGIRRYGFHGLSYENVAAELRRRYGAEAGGRVVAAHLGAGASLCALNDGASIATTMGMTPLGGIPMATRSGDLDPGVVLYLLEEFGLSASEMRDLLYRRSGLMGISAESGDMQLLLASAHPEAGEAIAYFVDRVQREVASLAAAVGGLDALVFTGGIGQHAGIIRSKICAACSWMGVAIDEDLNASNAEEIQSAESAVRVAVVKTDEEAIIATSVRGLVSD